MRGAEPLLPVIGCRGEELAVGRRKGSGGLLEGGPERRGEVRGGDRSVPHALNAQDACLDKHPIALVTCHPLRGFDDLDGCIGSKVGEQIIRTLLALATSCPRRHFEDI